MLNPKLLDLQTHYIHCNTLDESTELWKEIKEATDCYIPDARDIRRQHEYTAGRGVTYRVEMQRGYMLDWGWDKRVVYEGGGNLITEFQDAIFFLVISEIFLWMNTWISVPCFQKVRRRHVKSYAVQHGNPVHQLQDS